MSERDLIENQRRPYTRESIANDLRRMGMPSGVSVLLHSSLKSVGWVAGGSVAVVGAILDVLGPKGTLMVPTHSAANSDPANWENPPVPESWWDVIREHTPAYDPHATPTRGMGVIADTVRTWRGAIRSDHPQYSFAAVGADAAALIGVVTPLEDGLGDQSPLGSIYKDNGLVLLLGVPHSNNTSLHLCETRASWNGKPIERQGAALLVNGVRQWVNFEQVAWDNSDFDDLGSAFEAAHPKAVRIGMVGRATTRLMVHRALIDFGVKWMAENRGKPKSE